MSVTLLPGTFYYKDKTIPTTPYTWPGVGTGFIVSGNGGGNLGDGVLTGCYRAVLQCVDKTGDPTYSYCDYTFTYDHTPASGACGSRTPIGSFSYAATGTCVGDCGMPGNPTC